MIIFPFSFIRNIKIKLLNLTFNKSQEHFLYNLFFWPPTGWLSQQLIEGVHDWLVPPH